MIVLNYICIHHYLDLENYGIKIASFLVTTVISKYAIQLQEYLHEAVQVQPGHHGMLGDSVAWGGCTIIYLLGQQLHFELFDFSHQVLNVAEVEVATITSAHRNSHFLQV